MVSVVLSKGIKVSGFCRVVLKWEQSGPRSRAKVQVRTIPKVGRYLTGLGGFCLYHKEVVLIKGLEVLPLSAKESSMLEYLGVLGKQSSNSA